MKAHSLYSMALSACLIGTQAMPTTAKAIDFDKLNPMSLFKGKPEKSSPTLDEKRVQEVAANAMMEDARKALADGRESKAQGIYQEVTRKYRFTDAAGEAQFQYALLVRKNGKLRNAFDAFQKVVSDFRTSKRFTDAIEQQFEIAEEARGGKKQKSFLLIPMKLDPSEIIKMYEAIIKNGPYGKFAPLAQFAIGETNQEIGEKALSNAAFQAVVDNYPNTKQAAEAQFRIGAISGAAAKRTQDSSNLNFAREALETYKVSHPGGERMGEVESLLNQTNEELAQRSLSIARFYERAGKPKSAAIYYNDAIRVGSPESVLKARERLTALALVHGDALKENTDLAESDGPLVPAAVDLKSKDDYIGPPGPDLSKLGRKPKMRVDDENFKPLPIKEPELPIKSTTPPAPGLLIPPAPGEKPPVPPLPVPPPPDKEKSEQPAAPKQN